MWVSRGTREADWDRQRGTRPSCDRRRGRWHADEADAADEHGQIEEVVDFSRGRAGSCRKPLNRRGGEGLRVPRPHPPRPRSRSRTGMAFASARESPTGVDRRRAARYGHIVGCMMSSGPKRGDADHVPSEEVDRRRALDHRPLGSVAGSGLPVGVRVVAAGLESISRCGSIRDWAEQAFGKPCDTSPGGAGLVIVEAKNLVVRNQSVWQTPLRLGDREYGHGLCMDAPAKIRVTLPEAAEELTADIGIDNNQNTRSNPDVGSARFCVVVGDKRVFESPVFRLAHGATPVKVPLGGGARVPAGSRRRWRRRGLGPMRLGGCDGATCQRSNVAAG